MKKFLMVVLALVLVMALTACGDKPAEVKSDAPAEEAVENAEEKAAETVEAVEEKAEETAEAVEEKVEETTEAVEEKIEEAVEETAPAADLSNPDASVEFGDYAGMNSVADNIQNGTRMVGKVVAIDGVINQVGKFHTIGEKNEKGNFIGTKFFINDAADDAYPAKDAHVKLVGVVESNGSTAALYVNAADIQIVE